jgi:hypothetical protein
VGVLSPWPVVCTAEHIVVHGWGNVIEVT